MTRPDRPNEEISLDLLGDENIGLQKFHLVHIPRHNRSSRAGRRKRTVGPANEGLCERNLSKY